MPFDFGMLPPEITSTRMYAGDGSTTMLAAAAAWDGLAAKLQSAAATYASVISRLTTEEWLGPASSAMAAAAAPYAAWMNSTAARAEQAAIQARAAAAAYDSAFAMTVPPPVVAANRAQLSTLTATNLLGQNTPAIAATEAMYGEMWAQDAGAMYGYAGTSSAATRLAPFTAPQHNTQPGGQAGQGAAVAEAEGNAAAGNAQATLAQFTSAVPRTLQNMASPLDGFLNDPGGAGWGPNANIWNTFTSAGFANPAVVTSMMADMAMITSLENGGDVADMFGGSFQPGGVGIGAALGATHLVGAVKPDLALAGSGLGGGASAGMGRAMPVGGLSVPPSWATAAPGAPSATAMPGHSLAAAVPHNGTPGVPGMPLAGAGGRGANATGPRYGFRLTVMSRPPAAGYAPVIV